MIKGIIFDADGTLIDSMPIWRDVGEQYLLSIGIKPTENLADKLYFLSLEESAEYLKEKYQIMLGLKEIIDGFLKIVEDFYRNKVVLKDGILDFLKYLKKQNIPMTIATSGDKTLLSAALKRLSVLNYFDEIFTCSEYMTTKNELKIFNLCAEKMNLLPSDIVVFDDAVFALKTVKSGGFKAVGVMDLASINDKNEIIQLTDKYIESFENIDYNSLLKF